MDRKTISRMIKRYGAIVEEEDRKEKLLKTLSTDDVDIYTIKIPMVEYQEMKNKLFKYELIINTLKQCV
jgi:hypothetical protein